MNKVAKIWKSIWAVVAGIIVGIILTVATDLIFEGAGYSSLVVALIYRGIYLAVAGFIIAKLAPEKPMLLVNIAGIIGVVVTILGSFGNWQATLSAPWYPIALTIITWPCTWLGGKIVKK